MKSIAAESGLIISVRHFCCLIPYVLSVASFDLVSQPSLVGFPSSWLAHVTNFIKLNFPVPLIFGLFENRTIALNPY